MQDILMKLTIGSLLHDIGKILYRYNDGRNHSKSGAEYLHDEIQIEDQDILDQVQYHHAQYLKHADLRKDSLAYITYIADNIASAIDRRENDGEEAGFDREMPLESIFNHLNGNDEKLFYRSKPLDEDINYPADQVRGFDEEFYGGIIQHLQDNLHGITFTVEYIHSLLEILEADLSFIPSSTNKSEVGDISLYDHVKLTAAFANCIALYLKENQIEDYQQELYYNAKEFYTKKAFLLFSMDLSGIQDFIYTITSKNALKSLRSRSFYLEILMENMIDELLVSIGLSRANLLYSGGGHAYLILPNTEETKENIQHFEYSVNTWLQEKFNIALYLGCGYEACSANELYNEPTGSYRSIFRSVSNQISRKKAHRYSAKELFAMNYEKPHETDRECKVCHCSEQLNEDDVCCICDALVKMSANILYKGFYVIVNDPAGKVHLPMPGDHVMVSDSKWELIGKMKGDPENYIRSYAKNDPYSGYNVTKRLWIADYTSSDTFEELADNAIGINRIAVLRADVDNLGTAFENGFFSEKYGEQYMTISRTATFSRKMSMFFKYHLNAILRDGNYYITDEREPGERKITVVYSGGDDLFVVGSWDEIIGFAVDLHDALEEFAQGTLKISAGIGIFPKKYPVHNMAVRTGELEDCAKQNPGKNAITLFEEGLTFGWDSFENDVLETKLDFLKQFFNHFKEKGTAFLYRLLDLIRQIEDDRINLARLAYTMARLEDQIKQEDGQEQKDIRYFSSTIYQWSQTEQSRKELIAAIYLYVYLNRGEDER